MHFTYCPHCGNKLIDREIGDEGMIPYCESCQVPLWDMFSTGVICAVINEYDEIALIRQEYVSSTNYVCIAGIMQLGENAEETAIREIKEEIGLDVKKIQYIRSYFYDKKHMLMLGYKAIVRKVEFTLSKEVDSAAWVPLSEALSRLKDGSIAWQLVKETIEK
ncbi:NUDIX domain-containing protein [Anaerocolumna sedimenticola]|uniref:NAD(+) diphosphatase n=1 Tax=Anaerocolumna sedimenticola TaxID=2696063 RepID=A0A6P1TH89_9FIRM|nr:NUDIX domain-containing protein [Anaerocolumna sedimenticola]QHQ59793.1 NUDIX domain-containing protein [Anaerocolumna sedimenticola]